MSTRRVLLTGGRAPVTLDLARHGDEVYVAESAPRHLCQVSRSVRKSYAVPAPRQQPDAFVDALADIIRKHRIDMLVPTCEEVFYVSRGLSRLPCEVLTSPLDCLLRLHHKMRFIERVRGLGLPVPHTWLVESKQAMAAVPHRPLVVKPAYSRFGTQVHLVRNACPDVDVSPHKPWVAQEYIAGQGVCSYSLARDGVVKAHTAYRVRYTAGRSCVYFEHVDVAPLQHWVERLVSEENYTGHIAFDFIEDDRGAFYPIECNPRATSGVHLLAEQWWPALNSDRVLIPPPGTRKMLGAAMLMYALPKVRTWSDLVQWWRDFSSASEVMVCRADMAPALYQVRVLADLWKTGRRLGAGMMAATTWDIEWSRDL